MVMKSRSGVAPPAPKALNTRAAAGRRRAIFIAKYLEHHNATKAYIQAGYSPNGASQGAARLLADVKVQSAINAAERTVVVAALDRYEITTDKLQRELALIGFGNIMDYGGVDDDGEFRVDLSATTRDEAAALQAVKVKRSVRTVGDVDIVETTTELRMASKREALVELARQRGLYKDDGASMIPVRFIVDWGDKPPPEQYQALAREQALRDGGK